VASATKIVKKEIKVKSSSVTSLRLIEPVDAAAFPGAPEGTHGAGIDPRLRTFIDTCIVPILVRQFIAEIECKNELADKGPGAAHSLRTTAALARNERP
jgi:hypothetical protein